MTNCLKINNLSATVDNKLILKNINLSIKPGEIHILLGPNGAGKSSFANTIIGNPNYQIINGEIYLDAQNITELPINLRAQKGLFIAWQHPIEVPGVTNSDFLRLALKANGKNMGVIPFALMYEKTALGLDFSKDLPHRFLNENFSGGEKKKNEILQMAVLKPKYAILDEIDSGLDIDALKLVFKEINEQVKNGLGILMISHHQKILNYLTPDFIHVIIEGKIVKSGDVQLLKRIENDGYDWLKNVE